MTAKDKLIVALDVPTFDEASQIVETLRHGSNLLWLRRWGNVNLSAGLPDRWLAKLSICAFCQSHWAPLPALFAMFYGTTYLPGSLAMICEFLTVSLAITRTTQLLNDATHRFNRSPPSGEEIEEDRTDEVDAVDTAK